MKQYGSILLILFLLISPAYADDFSTCCDLTIAGNGTPCSMAINHQGPCNCNDTVGHTFMFVRTINQRLPISQGLKHCLIFDKKSDMRASFEIAPVYQQSVPFERASHYFLPNQKNSELVSGDDVTMNVPIRDIRAEWLGLPSDFNGRFSIEPEQRQMGIILTYNQDIGKILDSPLCQGAWVNIEAPLVAVESQMKVHQFDVSNPSPDYPPDIVAALQQRSWNYAQFKTGELNAVQLAEINFKLGRTFYSCNDFIISYYSILSVPTGNQRNPKYIFSPIAGYYGHVGLGGGVNFQLLLTKECDAIATCFFLNLESLFLIRNTETRTFDLVNKPWSRYLLLTNKHGPLGNTTPGVNILSQQVRVHPYGFADCDLGFRFKTGHVEIEIGYDIWGHPEERIELLCQFPKNWGIAGNPDGVNPADLPFDTYSVTASQSTIAQQAPNDVDSADKPVFKPITASDLDLHSAACQPTILHEVFAAFTFYKRGRCIDGAFTLGFFCDFPQFNATLKLVGAWAKVGATF